MKTIRFIAVTALASLMCIGGLTSCHRSGNDDEKQNVKSQQEQKEYLESVANELMDLVPAHEFKGITDFAKLQILTLPAFDWDSVGLWVENVLKASVQPLDASGMNYKYLLLASNFTGHFTERIGLGEIGWDYKAADDLQFVYTDLMGNRVRMKLVTEGETVNVHIGDFTEYSLIGNHPMEFNSRYEVGFPEKIAVSIECNDSTMLSTVFRFNLEGIEDTEFNLASSNLAFSAMVELINGYSIGIEQLAYKGNSNISLKVALKKGNKDLVGVAAGTDFTGMPDYDISGFSQGKDFDIDIQNVRISNTYVNVDVLGRIQLRGRVKDLTAILYCLENADRCNRNEAEFKSYIANANSLMEVGLYYDNKTVKNAELKFEPIKDGNSDIWYAVPVICFEGGKTYVTVESFFSEINFKDVIDRFNEWLESYKKLILSI